MCKMISLSSSSTDKAMTSVLLPRWTRQDQSPATSWTWRTPFSGEFLSWPQERLPALHGSVVFSMSNVCACMYVQVHRHHPQPPSRLTLHLPLWEHVEHGSSLQHESGDGCIRWTHRETTLHLFTRDIQLQSLHLTEGSWPQPTKRCRESSHLALTGDTNYYSLLQTWGCLRLCAERSQHSV